MVNLVAYKICAGNLPEALDIIRENGGEVVSADRDYKAYFPQENVLKKDYYYTVLLKTDNNIRIGNKLHDRCCIYKF